MLFEQTHMAQLYPGDLQVWITDIQDWISEEKEYLLTLLDQDELKRLQRYKITAKQDQFLCSRALLKSVLSTYLEIDPSEIHLSTSPAGKPFLPDQSIQFNLSHSGNLLVLGIGLFEQIGVDVQEEYSISNLETIVKRYFSPEERDYLSNLDPDLRQAEFFSIWSAKEAYLKALGEGFHMTPQSISILPDPKRLGSYHLTEQNRPNPDQHRTIRELDLQPGYKGAAAVIGKLNKLVMLPLRLDTP